MALAGVVAFVLALPLAVASAGPVGDGSSRAGRGPVPADDRPRVPGPRRSAPPPGLGPATAFRCGPELSSPDGVEAQTCVLTRGGETWARAYYRNATGDALSSALSLMGPGGRTVQMDCAVDAEDDPGTCETPGQRSAGDPGAYSAVAEFARSADGPLLLRSGSNSGRR
ncbi:hypothetical protein ACH4S8_23785 [Streptomyces sp. NPDC021080]|uniref:hypothetical protein n=1 Tax=Streptomyces sp. NPDC021080 TaxID=3365110 RepID=UPI0037A8438F